MKKFLTCCILALLLTAFATFAQSSVGYPSSAKLQGRKVYEPSLRAPSDASRYEGVVVVKVWVDQYGRVKRAEPGADGTTVTNAKLWAAARAAAMEARFTTKHDAPALQEGVITYSFKYSEEAGPVVREDVFTFAGVPITGTETEMRKALIQKGFKSDFSSLEGMFNGEKVTVFISTNHETVDRVRAMYPSCRTSNDARIKYNVLLSKFNRNSKYVCANPREEIPAGENIYRNLQNNSKHYEAIYFYITPDVDAQGWVTSFKQEYEKKYGKVLEALSYEETEEALFCLPSAIVDKVVGVVYFTFLNDCCITIDYINLKNRPRGEDL